MEELIFHNSHDNAFRSPFGAIESGIRLSIALLISKDLNHKEVFIHIIKRDAEEKIKMEAFESSTDDYRYKVNVDSKDYSGLIFYYFSISNDENIIYYGNNPDILGGIGHRYSDIPPGYQITVYKKHHVVPDWFKSSVVYQIFPDRFYNKNHYIKNPKKNSFVYANWDDEPFYIKDSNGRIQRWDFFGGNIEGIIEKLPYIKDLGISTIYLNPIFEAPSNHRYDTSNYKRIDPILGDNDDFERLCSIAKDLEIKIILDGVFSHTGDDSVYFNRYGNFNEIGAYQSKESKYYSWYKFDQYPNKYKGWWDIDEMPNVSELNDSYLDYMMRDDDSVITNWMKKGAMGWRLDVADELPDEFIKLLKKKIKRLNPDSVLIGEVWEDASNKISYGLRREYFYGEELDSVTNYPLRNIMIDFITNKVNASKVHSSIMNLYENYPRENFYSCLNLIGGHDVARILTIMENKYENVETSIKALKLIIIFQMTFPGVPCIYYGDEAGLRGSTDPHNRKTYPWGNENKEILNFYKEMIKLRNSDDVFVNGDFHSLYITDDIYAFTRSNDKKMVLIAINKSLEQKTCKLPFMEDELVLESMSWIIKEKLSIIRNCQADSGYIPQG